MSDSHSDATPTDHFSTFERYRGVIVRVGGLLALIIGIVLGVRYLVGSGPAEKYRVNHPAGYSVIRPSDWMANVIATPTSDGFVDAIVMAPQRWKGLEPAMWVKRYAFPPDVNKLESMGFQQRPFQGEAVWTHQVKPKRDLIRTAIVHRGDSWFNVGVSLPDLEAVKVDDWWRYIETFRSTRPATQMDSSVTQPTTADSP